MYHEPAAISRARVGANLRHCYASSIVPSIRADSGDISLQEMRLMLEQIFPDVSRPQFATLMKDLRGLADNNNSYDEQSFLDAVMLAFQVRRPKLLVHTCPP